jgi:methionine synthase II (cobalamin-independent)
MATPEARLVVVDDEPNIRELLSTSLRFAGFEVHAAADGNGALQLVRDLDPDLVVLRELPSKTIMLGVLDLGDPAVEEPETVAGRIMAGLEHVPPERLVVAPDCGMKYLARETALGKLSAMVAGTRMVRETL